MPSRWERLLEQKPVSLLEHLLEEVARQMASELCQWPPSVSASEGAPAQGLPEGAPPPLAQAYEEGFRLARWDLERRFDAVDDYMRNKRWQERGLTAADKPTLLFLSRWLVEYLLELGEATLGKVNRPRMLEALDQAQRHFFTLRAR
jgi:hypothetical protein